MESHITIEIKKGLLLEHIDEVRRISSSWIEEVRAPVPFHVHLDNNVVKSGWGEVYTPTTEKEADNNHIIRHHLKSRALWHHHAEWQLRLKETWTLSETIREMAEKERDLITVSRANAMTDAYVPTALWQAFELKLEKKFHKLYREPDNKIGVRLGSYLIEESAQNPDVREKIEAEHCDLIYKTAAYPEMGRLLTLWVKVREIEDKVRYLAGTSVKANDFLYPCRFCRHLWK
ncbi:MAG: hypothetical protein ABSG90_13995 [Dehalococcoidia bacterium]